MINRMFSRLALLDSGLSARGTGPVTAQAGGEILVHFSGEGSLGALLSGLGGVGGRISDVVSGTLGGAGDGALLRISLGKGVGAELAASILSKIPGVDYAEPNFTYFVDSTSNDPGYSGGQLWGMYGDQTNPTNQYGSQAGEAWADGHTGSTKVVIGVVDTGINYSHPDLYLNVWLNPGEIPVAMRGALVDSDADGIITFRDLNAAANAAFVSDRNSNGYIDAKDLLTDTRWSNAIDDDGNGYKDDLIGWDFVNNDNDPFDDNGHGTHVSGTIGAIGGNGTGVAGVNWTAQIMALKFLSSNGSGSTDDAVKAIDYYTAAKAASPNVDFAALNNSWGGGGKSQALLDAIVRAGRADVLFVAAAGNGGWDGRGDNNDSSTNYPSNYNTIAQLGWNSVIAVASINSSGALSSFSNYGLGSVHLGAPGEAIYSTLASGQYGTYSGTSMATPHVTGAIALYSSLSDDSSATIVAKLLGSTEPTASLANKTISGGRLDVDALLDLVGQPAPPQPPHLIYGTMGNDNILGTTGADKIWGVPATGTMLGKARIDTLNGNGGSDTFVLGDARGVFYDDGKASAAGTGDYARIRGFGADDHIQLRGAPDDYFQHAATGGMGIYFDTNNNNAWDSRDELIGLVENVTQPLDSGQFIFV